MEGENLVSLDTTPEPCQMAIGTIGVKGLRDEDE